MTSRFWKLLWAANSICAWALTCCDMSTQDWRSPLHCAMYTSHHSSHTNLLNQPFVSLSNCAIALDLSPPEIHAQTNSQQLLNISLKWLESSACWFGGVSEGLHLSGGGLLNSLCMVLLCSANDWYDLDSVETKNRPDELRLHLLVFSTFC